MGAYTPIFVVAASAYLIALLVVHDALRRPGAIAGEDDVRTLAESVGGDVTRRDRDLQTHRPEINAVLDRNKRETSALALRGTPAFIINGNLIPGGMPLTQATGGDCPHPRGRTAGLNGGRPPWPI
jgi:hypothetical protein